MAILTADRPAPLVCIKQRCLRAERVECSTIRLEPAGACGPDDHAVDARWEQQGGVHLPFTVCAQYRNSPRMAELGEWNHAQYVGRIDVPSYTPAHAGCTGTFTTAS